MPADSPLAGNSAFVLRSGTSIPVNFRIGNAMSKYHVTRTDRAITDREEISRIIRHGKYITIAMARDNEPYVVTMNYGYDDGTHALYFHCSPEGQKMEFIRSNPDVCGTVIVDKGYVMNECAHEYESVVVRGTMSVVEDLQQKKHAMDMLLNHLEENPDIVRKNSLKDEGRYLSVGILKLSIAEITGKKGR